MVLWNLSNRKKTARLEQVPDKHHICGIACIKLQWQPFLKQAHDVMLTFKQC